MLSYFLDAQYFNYILLAGGLLAFAATFIVLKTCMHRLPTDIGRAFAVNAEKAKGKPRGAGVIFIPIYCICCLIFAPLTIEYAIYGTLLMAVMLTGYLDDASKNPWSDYKKGFFDLLISVGVATTYALNNSTEVRLEIISNVFGVDASFTIPLVVYIILGTVLVWMSINVVNCTDGVDGLCTTLTLLVLLTFLFLEGSSDLPAHIIVMMGALAAYLWFNCSPSILLMGDAGSRPIGVFLAIAAMKCGDPFLYIPICLIFILDGGMGLVKVFLLRFFKIHIFKNTRMPLHDNARKNKGWSDTQTVIRFNICQLVISLIIILLIGFHI
ncbi:MAG: phospho-N-acetylmuramoyl-pentapeptide-transferase [Lachnospiraceae bacterium]|nr:phospho-N-acetylmuramoyl-pentapeptide-transferase [Lachnospiraceae bacterium]